MRSGGGKSKGSSFERLVCQRLSLWMTGGKRKDLFWRSAMSGGRATVAKGEVQQAGDITAVADEGHALTNFFYIECKTYRSLQFEAAVLEGKGLLWRFWKETCRQARVYHRQPMLIAKQNRSPVVIMVRQSTHLPIGLEPVSRVTIVHGFVSCDMYLFDEVMDGICTLNSES